MLSQEKLQEYLSRCMESAADFAEIFEEYEENETIETLDCRVERSSGRSCPASASACIGVCSPFTAIRMRRMISLFCRSWMICGTRSAEKKKKNHPWFFPAWNTKTAIP